MIYSTNNSDVRFTIHAIVTCKEWQYFVTFDESCFYLSIDYEIIELPDGESLPEKEKHMIHARKMMVTIT
jgi:hypothetical protein